MKTKIFTLNDNNKIEFTEEELKSLLDEIYNDGYYDGICSNRYYYTTPHRPWYTSPWYVTTCDSTSNNINGNISSSCSDSTTVKYECPSTAGICKCKGE